MFYDRTIQGFDGQSIERVEDYAYSLGIKGRTANEISADEHVNVLKLASSASTVQSARLVTWVMNVTYDEFKDLYYQAWVGGCKGITTFRASGKRYGILNEANDNEPAAEKAEACFIDPETGQKSCE